MIAEECSFLVITVCSSVRVPETGDSAETALCISFRVVEGVVAESPVSGTLRLLTTVPDLYNVFLCKAEDGLIAECFFSSDD